MTNIPGSMGTFTGINVVLNPLLTERVLHARSPSRAARRARLGHRQNIITRPSRQLLMLADGTVTMHPERWAALRAASASFALATSTSAAPAPPPPPPPPSDEERARIAERRMAERVRAWADGFNTREWQVRSRPPLGEKVQTFLGLYNRFIQGGV